MKNLLSRDEYLNKIEEGIVRDTIRRGIQKVKELFTLGMKKIKGFLTIFDDKGNVLPVISLQSMIDKFGHGSEVKVYAPKNLSSMVTEAGGEGCDAKASAVSSDEIYDLGPDGKDFADWMDNEEYKNTPEYKNFMALPGIIKENYDDMTDDMKKLFEGFVTEGWSEVVANRVKYNKDRNGEMKEAHTIGIEEFKDILRQMVDETVFGDLEEGEEPIRNIIVFGAPGIGKSTIPEAIIDEYNAKAEGDASKEMSLITVDCPNIAVGDFMMPTIPTKKNVLDELETYKDVFTTSNTYLDGLSDEQKGKVLSALKASKQFEAGEAPKWWLPSYKDTGDPETNRLLDDYANGGVTVKVDRKNGVRTISSHKTGNGGIIMFDELLRTDPNVFKQLMIFLLTRRFNGWTLGSKWVIIACSNRPADDDEVLDVWNTWDRTPASKDRFAYFYHLEPNPQEWVSWVKKKGCDELILKFIFDENSKTGDKEYPRWHSTVKSGGGEQLAPITPRRWVDAINAVNKYERRKDLKDLNMFSESDLKRVFGGIFDDSFVEEIVEWMVKNATKVDLDEVMKNPDKVYFPEKYNGNDEAEAGQLIENLFSSFKERFEEKPEECSDDMLANIFYWLGKNYSRNANIVQTGFVHKVDKVLGEWSASHKKSIMMLLAAYPEKDLEKQCETYEEYDILDAGSFDEIKKMMKQYFPYRMDGDEINFYDDLFIG